MTCMTALIPDAAEHTVNAASLCWLTTCNQDTHMCPHEPVTGGTTCSGAVGRSCTFFSCGFLPLGDEHPVSEGEAVEHRREQNVKSKQRADRERSEG